MSAPSLSPSEDGRSGAGLPIPGDALAPPRPSSGLPQLLGEAEAPGRWGTSHLSSLTELLLSSSYQIYLLLKEKIIKKALQVWARNYLLRIWPKLIPAYARSSHAVVIHDFSQKHTAVTADAPRVAAGPRQPRRGAPRCRPRWGDPPLGGALAAGAAHRRASAGRGERRWRWRGRVGPPGRWRRWGGRGGLGGTKGTTVRGAAPPGRAPCPSRLCLSAWRSPPPWGRPVTSPLSPLGFRGSLVSRSPARTPRAAAGGSPRHGLHLRRLLLHAVAGPLRRPHLLRHLACEYPSPPPPPAPPPPAETVKNSSSPGKGGGRGRAARGAWGERGGGTGWGGQPRARGAEAKRSLPACAAGVSRRERALPALPSPVRPPRTGGGARTDRPRRETSARSGYFIYWVFTSVKTSGNASVIACNNILGRPRFWEVLAAWMLP